MMAIRLTWDIHVIKEDIITVTRHYTKTPIGTIEISIVEGYGNSVGIDVFDCSNTFSDYIKSNLENWVNRTDFSLGHIKQMAQASFDSFVYEKLQVV